MADRQSHYEKRSERSELDQCQQKLVLCERGRDKLAADLNACRADLQSAIEKIEEHEEAHDQNEQFCDGVREAFEEEEEKLKRQIEQLKKMVAEKDAKLQQYENPEDMEEKEKAPVEPILMGKKRKMEPSTSMDSSEETVPAGELTACKMQVEDLQEQLRKLRVEKGVVREQSLEANEEMGDLNDQFIKLQETLRSTEEKLTQADTELTTCKGHNADLRAELQKEQAEHRIARDYAAAIKEELVQLYNEVALSNQQIAEFNATLASTVEANQAQQSTDQMRTTALKSEFRKIKDSYKTSLAQANDLRDSVQSLSGQKEELERNIQASQGLIASQQGEISLNTKRIDDFTVELARIKADYETARQQLEATQAQLQESNRQSDELSAVVRTLADKKETLEAEISMKSKLIEDLQMKNVKGNADYDNARKTLNTTQAEVQRQTGLKLEAEAALLKATQDLENTNAEVSRQKMQIDAFKASYGQLQTQASTAQSAHEEAQRKLAETYSQLADTNISLRKAAEDLALNKAEVSNQQILIDASKKSIRDLQIKSDTTQKAYEAAQQRLTETKSRLDEATDSLRKATEELSAKRTDIENAQTHLTELFDKEVQNAGADKSTFEMRAGGLTAENERLKKDYASSRRTSETLRTELQTAEEKLRKIENELRECKSSESVAGISIKDNEAKIKNLEKDYESARNLIAELKRVNVDLKEKITEREGELMRCQTDKKALETRITDEANKKAKAILKDLEDCQSSLSAAQNDLKKTKEENERLRSAGLQNAEKEGPVLPSVPSAEEIKIAERVNVLMKDDGSYKTLLENIAGILNMKGQSDVNVIYSTIQSIMQMSNELVYNEIGTLDALRNKLQKIKDCEDELKKCKNDRPVPMPSCDYFTKTLDRIADVLEMKNKSDYSRMIEHVTDLRYLEKELKKRELTGPAQVLKSLDDLKHCQDELKKCQNDRPIPLPSCDYFYKALQRIAAIVEKGEDEHGYDGMIKRIQDLRDAAQKLKDCQDELKKCQDSLAVRPAVREPATELSTPAQVSVKTEEACVTPTPGTLAAMANGGACVPEDGKPVAPECCLGTKQLRIPRASARGEPRYEALAPGMRMMMQLRKARNAVLKDDARLDHLANAKAIAAHLLETKDYAEGEAKFLSKPDMDAMLGRIDIDKYRERHMEMDDQAHFWKVKGTEGVPEDVAEFARLIKGQGEKRGL